MSFLEICLRVQGYSVVLSFGPSRWRSHTRGKREEGRVREFWVGFICFTLQPVSIWQVHINQNLDGNSQGGKKFPQSQVLPFIHSFIHSDTHIHTTSIPCPLPRSHCGAVFSQIIYIARTLRRQPTNSLFHPKKR